MEGIILIYLIYAATCLLVIGLAGALSRAFRKHRPQIARWILLNIYHDDLGGRLK